MSEEKGMQSTDLISIMKHIGKRYTFTADHYPILSLLNHDQKMAFTVSHSAHHMSKSLGKISAECEAFDHGGELNKATLEEATVKIFISVIKLAEELGMTAADMCEKIPTYMRNK